MRRFLFVLVLAGCTPLPALLADGGTVVNGDPYAELLALGLGSYSGDCLSLSTGVAAVGAIELLAGGALNTPEFTTLVSRDTHTLALSHGGASQAEWSAVQTTGDNRTGMTLNFDSSADPDLNRAYARREDTHENKGLDCRGASTAAIAKATAFDVFNKYLVAPKAVFAACQCGLDGQSPTTTTGFSSDGKTLSIGSNTFDLSAAALERDVIVSPGVGGGRIFTYGLKTSETTFASYHFNGALELESAQAQFASGIACACTRGF